MAIDDRSPRAAAHVPRVNPREHEPNRHRAGSQEGADRRERYDERGCVRGDLKRVHDPRAMVIRPPDSVRAPAGLLPTLASFRYSVVDVFTDRPLAGNQLAVFTDARAIGEELLQPLAREMNFSETVFVYPPLAEGHVRIRIFTPMTEVPFAGHPVLGTAFVLGGPLQALEVRLETAAGVVPVALEREGPRIVFGRMSQPLPRVEPFPPERELLEALGVERSELPVELYDLGMRHVYVALATKDAVERLAPDLAALSRICGFVGANCFAGEGTSWKTRMFFPVHGVPEDAATGSAAGPLACHLARHGLIEFGEEIEISQGAEIGRPSTLYARVEGSRERIERVEVGGSAVSVARGEFRLG